MFFSDLTALQKIATKQHNPLEIRYGDHAGDPEIERMLYGSPLITGWEPTVPCQELYAGNDQDSFNDRFDVSGKSSRKRWKEIFGSHHQSSDSQYLFKERYIPFLGTPNGERHSSALTKLMEESKKTRRKEKNMAGKIKLTVYLPDYSNFNVYASEKMTISDLRNLILHEHLEQGLIPPFNYNNPSAYELRMTDGDGEPDRDFPALGLTQRLGELGIDEVCICEIDGGRGGGGGGGGRGGGKYSSHHTSSKRGKQSVDFTFSASQFGSIPYGRSISNARSTPPPFLSGAEPYNQAIPPSCLRDRFDENDDEEDDDEDDDRGSGSSSLDYGNPNKPEDRIATIKFPNGQEITLPYDAQSTLKNLLPVIAETHKLLLHSADYIFCVPNVEMKRLKLMFPSVDMNVAIDSIGCQTFELQNHIFADSNVPKVPVPDIVTKSQRERMAAASSAAAAAAAGDSEGIFVFTEATANAYKEWNVVKKNKFGRRQERVFGVDGKKVYNAKRGQLKGNQSGVQRNQRDISTIVKVDILSSDPKTFRITWAEDRDMINIEYTCDTSREAQEIVAKIKFLVNKTVRSAVGRSGRLIRS